MGSETACQECPGLSLKTLPDSPLDDYWVEAKIVLFLALSEETIHQEEIARGHLRKTAKSSALRNRKSKARK